ncbi:MAG: nucleotide sugar dehydrogenase [Nitrospiraceae bacterium]|nr:nucleotide sugar dehydrogenase [Nitrospiraceae bacterium]
MKISVFGLGYVGTVSAGCLAASGHTVWGVDVNVDKVASINSGRAPIVEPDISDFIAKALTQGLLKATVSSAEGILNTDVSFICVGTPSHVNGSLDLTYLKRVCEDIGVALQNKKSAHTIVFRSTTLPGTTEEVAIPILEKHSGKTIGKGFHVCYNPEFLREGTSVKDYYHPPKIVIGERNGGEGDVIEEIYAGIKAPTIRTSIRAAEMVKYSDNAFHALKVAYANEIGSMCKSFGIDSHVVMDIFCQDTKLNLSKVYLKPGFAFGGSCLPKDLRALSYQAKRADVEVPILNAILQSNAVHIKGVIQRIVALGKKRVGFLGMTFKPDTDDLRESPLVEVIETLLGKGFHVKIYDRNVATSRLIGANKQFIGEHIPHLSSLLVERAEDVVDTAQVVVVGYASAEFVPALKSMRADQLIIDLARIEGHESFTASYDGICW